MNTRIHSIRLALVALGAVAVQHDALADCAGASVREVHDAYTQAQKLDSQGKFEAALGQYVHAQEYTCEANPVEAKAAERAAALSLPLAQAAEQRGDFEHAFRLYDDGGHFAKADAVLTAQLQVNADDPRAFESARAHFENRALPAFQSNNAIRLIVTGPYAVSPKHIAALLAMPAKGVERALRQEANDFNEEYLRDRVHLIQSRPNALSDSAAVQSSMSAQRAFVQKWPEDLLKKSRATLAALGQWGRVTRDEQLRQSVELDFARRIEQHIDALTQRFNGAPELLEAAIDYVHLLSLETGPTATRVAKIKNQSITLGDAASTAQRLALASDYYRVGGDDAKAEAAQDRMRKAAMAKMQPSIDAMQRQAAVIQAQYADPERVKAMQAQAEAMRKSLEQQRTANPRKASAAELEKELGL